MPYAFLRPDGSIKLVVPKPTPFMKVLPGERIVNYNPPPADPELMTTVPVEPVPADTMDVQFTTTYKDKATTENVLMRRKTALIQYHLDTTAQSRGYDNILAAVSYATSRHPVYSVEGQAFAIWRDQCWDITFATLDAVFSGEATMPSDAALVAQLPAFTG